MIVPRKERFRKVIIPPPDKSTTQRAIILSLLTKKMRIYNPSLCGDCISALDCVTALGATVKITNDYIEICCKTIKNEGTTRLYAGNSATTARLLLGLCAGLGLDVCINGDSSLKKRSMKSTIRALKKMRAKLQATRLKCPITNTPNKIKGIDFAPPTPSAQVKSAVMLASLNAKSPSIIRETVKTRDHTERMLTFLGFRVEQNDEFVKVYPSKCDVLNPVISIAGDVSSAGFLIAVALLVKDGYAFVSDVGINPTRLGMINLLINAGANIVIEPSGEVSGEPIGNIIVNQSNLSAFELDAFTSADLIDEIPILAVIACFCNGKSVFKNLDMIKNKESNRMREIFKYLKKFGANVELEDNTLSITGNNLVKNAEDIRQASLIKRKKRKKLLSIKAKDHRIIMAMAVAGVVTDGCVIEFPSFVSISYPNFFSALLD